MSKYKKTVPPFLFLGGQYICINMFIFIIMLRFVETIFKRKLNTLVTKYTDILIFDFAHTYIIYILSGA